MKILEVIHGYPPLYNAGSEIYTRTISRGFVKAGHNVVVFTREEDPYRPDFDVIVDFDDLEPLIRLYRVNHARSRDRYRNLQMDTVFDEILEKEKPDVVHIGHLNHLSTGIPEVANKRGIPVVFTFHDFWLACPRGQFLQMCLGEKEVWRLCPGQDDERCAIHCMSRIWGGVPGRAEDDLEQWVSWIRTRMEEIHRQIKNIDLFISPSKHLKTRMIRELSLDPGKVVYEPYGFELSRFANRNRIRGDGVVFGYIGRITPSKGIDHLIHAFGKTTGNARLRIWGRSSFPDSVALERITGDIPAERKDHINWMPEYRNESITQEVFNNVDVIVVPSIWDENSPLVIHEAQQAGIPVITADHAGMSELVRHNINGLLFTHRDIDDLALKLQSAIDVPDILPTLGKRGYLDSKDGNIPELSSHIKKLHHLFERTIDNRGDVLCH